MTGQFLLGIITGIGVGISLMAIVTFAYVKYDLRKKALPRIKPFVPALLVALAVLVLFGATGGVRADTPVPLTIPTNQIFTSANDWITTFAPIAAIGIGISIALAVLGYLGKMIVSAFRA